MISFGQVKKSFPAICLVWIAWLAHAGCGPSEPTLNPTGLTAIEKVSKKDWRGLWAMASDEEKQMMGIGQEQFVRLSEIITEGFPENLSCKLYDEFRPTKFERTYAVKLMARQELGPDLKGQSNLISIEVRLVSGQWKPVIASIPLQLSRFQNEGANARHRRLLRAMEDSRISWLMLDRRKLRIEDQRLVVEGKLKQMEAFR